MHVGLRRAVDGDPPRLHGFGNFPDQFDLQKTVVEGRVLDLDVVGQVELPFEVAGRDTPVKELAFGFLGLAAFDGDDVLLCSDRDFIRRETRDRQRDLVTVFGQPFDVVGRIAFLGAALGGLGEVEQTIETDGRPESYGRAGRGALTALSFAVRLFASPAHGEVQLVLLLLPTGVLGLRALFQCGPLGLDGLVEKTQRGLIGLQLSP